MGNLGTGTNNNSICNSEGIWNIVKKEDFMEINSQRQLRQQKEPNKTRKKWAWS